MPRCLNDTIHQEITREVLDDKDGGFRFECVKFE